MGVSVFDLFSIGIGPSSSHTIGPMRAAKRFLNILEESHTLELVAKIRVDLYGSLALTGRGHRTDVAIMLGLSGEVPESVDTECVDEKIEVIRTHKSILLAGKRKISFDSEKDILFHMNKRLPYHSNTLRLTAYDSGGRKVLSEVYYSIGGGFILNHAEMTQSGPAENKGAQVSYPFRTARELLRICLEQEMSIADVMMENERILRKPQEIKEGLLHIWSVMLGCIERGCRHEGILPGGLGVKRRAPSIYQKLHHAHHKDPSITMDWLSLWALAVNEENAAGGRVVTTPTNGAAGIIPSVLSYYLKFHEPSSDDDVVTFLLTAGAIGILYKEGASISAAEMGCQGEVGVACSMAAGGLAAIMGGSPEQVENAAEIGMEHNLGLTCDPVNGLVQIPCIERNTMGAVKAVNAAKLALHGDGFHKVSLDAVIATMKETGLEMNSIYKETSLGGLAVNIAEC